jgi:hypothetical protein
MTYLNVPVAIITEGLDVKHDSDGDKSKETYKKNLRYIKIL